MSRIMVNVLNKLHFPVEVEGHVFMPREEVIIEVESSSMSFRNIRAHKGLRVGKHDNDSWKEKNLINKHYDFNMVYDRAELPRSHVYTKVIQSLANPIIKHLPPGSAGYIQHPSLGINARFFSELRINQQGKYPVGPNDVFISHGIADKNYWRADKIKRFQYALVPGPAWKERIMKGGYRGKVFVVGYTKLDPVFNGGYKRQERQRPYVVWAPTHSYHKKNKGRSSFPACNRLIEQIPDCYEKDTALHPSARKQKKGLHDITMQELIDADVVIADAGSTLYEAWLLGKPVIFPDWLCKRDVLNHFKDDPDNFEYQIYDKGIGYHAKDMKHLISLIEDALVYGMGEPEIEFIEKVFPSELRGKAGKNSAEALQEIQEEIKKTGVS